MSTYKEIVTADLRLCILRVAGAAPGYEVNANILRMALEENGHRISADMLKSQMAWLEEQGLVSVRAVGSIHMARLTTRGLDVSKGRANVPGVARPGPEES